MTSLPSKLRARARPPERILDTPDNLKSAKQARPNAGPSHLNPEDLTNKSRLMSSGLKTLHTFHPGGGGYMTDTITETTSETKFDLAAIQLALRENKIDGWLFYDHHHRDPLAYSILGLDPNAHVTRRWYYFVPADSKAEPKKLVHRIEAGRLDTLPGTKSVYSSWQELESQIAALLTGATKI